MKSILLYFTYIITSVNLSLCSDAGNGTITNIGSVEINHSEEKHPVSMTTEHCSESWRTNGTDSLKCLPICDPECVYSRCTKSNPCPCTTVHNFVSNSTSTCYNFCESCIHGQCVGDQTCHCFDHDKPAACLNRCEFVITNPVSYETDDKCLKFKIMSNFKAKSHCSITKAVHDRMFNNDNFMSSFLVECSTNRTNITQEISCFFTNHTAELREVNGSLLANNSDWQNVTLVIYWTSEINVSSKSVFHFEPDDWTFNTGGTVSSCGETDFTAWLVRVQSPSRLNTTAMWWISIILLLVFIVFSVSGMSYFLWVRHRRLNNPLNYKENMMRGYHNQVYNNCTRELASDDEEEEEDPVEMGTF